MSHYWSSDDKLFVDGKLEVLWFDLVFASSPSQHLPLERRSGVVYDGPTGDNFKDYLSKMGFHVNNKGRVIVATAQLDSNTAEAFHYFLLEKVVPLGRFGFPNKPIPRWSEMQTQLNKMKAELATKNEALSESQRLFYDFKFPLSRSIKRGKSRGTELVEFMRRMNRTFVNRAGKYLRFEFSFTKFSGIRLFMDDGLRYYTRNYHMCDIFRMVQFDVTEPAKALEERQGSVPEPTPNNLLFQGNVARLIDQDLGESSAITLNEFCFIGKITRASDETFHQNALVTVFFEQSEHGDDCYVDSLATTFFVLAGNAYSYDIPSKVAPGFV